MKNGGFMGWIPRNKWWIYGDFMVMIMAIYVDLMRLSNEINGNMWENEWKILFQTIQATTYPRKCQQI